MLFGRESLLKLLSCISMTAVFAFANVGSAYAVDEAVDEVEAAAGVDTLCEDTGGVWTNNMCSCDTAKNSMYDQSTQQCVCRVGYALPQGASLKESACVFDAVAAQEACVSSDSEGTAWDSQRNLCVCVQGDLFNSETGRCEKATSEDMEKACGESGGTWNSGCQCPGNSSLINSVCVCNSGYIMTGGQCVLEQGNANSGSGGSSNGIKIATDAFNTVKFTPVESSLATAVGTIKTVVANAIANTTKVNAIQNAKQTRPLEDGTDLNTCPANKQCLLVTAPNQTPKWYEIIDCVGDNVLSGITNVEGTVNIGPGEPFGYKLDGSTSDFLMCRSQYDSVIGCQNGEWVTSYDRNVSEVGDEIVFGTMRRVAIAENTRGTIVELPNGVASGDVCVCKATRYRVWNSASSSYDASRSISTNKWFVAGTANSDQACLVSCARDLNSPNKVSYLHDIANSCSADAQTANMCTYDPWFASIVRSNTEESVVGYDSIDAQTTGLCVNPVSGSAIYNWCNSSAGSDATVATSWCYIDSDNNTRICGQNSWIVRYSMNDSVNGGANNPELYGRAFCTDMDTTGVAAGTVLTDAEIGNKSILGYDDNGLACVCQLQGYKNANDTVMTTIQNPTKYLYSGVRYGKCLQVCQQACTQYFGNNHDNGIIRDLAGTCPLN